MVWALMAAFVIIGVPVLLAILRRKSIDRVTRAATVSLVADEHGVQRTLADGRVEEIAWHEITEVEVITTNVGVHKEDGALLVLGAGPTRGCLVPSGQSADVIPRLQQLPGFDTRRLVQALEQPPPSRTSCWTRQPYPDKR